MSYRKPENIPFFVLFILYITSVLFIVFNKVFRLAEDDYYQIHIFSIPQVWARGLNIIFLIANLVLIYQIFNQRERETSGTLMGFVYALMHNKIWFWNNVHQYLINDFLILIFLFFIYFREVKTHINILILYLGMFFGSEFLLGINMFYTILIPIVICSLFLMHNWKSWIIFVIGFLLPIYFLISISWLIDANSLPYLATIINQSLYTLHQWSPSRLIFVGKMQWMGLGILLNVCLLLISGLKELNDASYYSSMSRKIALFFFFLILFSFAHYLLIYLFYHQYAPSLIALAFAYYVGNYIYKAGPRLKYFILFLLFVLTSFL